MAVNWLWLKSLQKMIRQDDKFTAVTFLSRNLFKHELSRQGTSLQIIQLLNEHQFVFSARSQHVVTGNKRPCKHAQRSIRRRYALVRCKRNTNERGVSYANGKQIPLITISPPPESISLLACYNAGVGRAERLPRNKTTRADCLS